MLFNSYGFIFIFLPVVFLGYFYLGKDKPNLSNLWLACASIFFYGYWNMHYVALLLGSIAFNFYAGNLISKSLAFPKKSKLILISAILINLSLLGYYKYAGFLILNISHLIGLSVPTLSIVLPLGISFFTFTQIAFLVDTYQDKVKEVSFIKYTIFVTYFPHLIAGPVLHHKEMMPQFSERSNSLINWNNVTAGLSIFVIGLAKKLLIADTLAVVADPIFAGVATGKLPMMLESWVGALAYSLQLYFDFSAYSDMAIGISLMFNVRLPMNFNSPYKSLNIIDFWRRWHITLSRFLRDYLYIPLGGNRKGNFHRYLNLMITMVLGGLWHGAGWTFVVWGGLHGFYLLTNHAWNGLKNKMNWSNGGKLMRLASCTLTFLAVVVGWVFFRSDSITSALVMLQGMIGMHGLIEKWVAIRSGFELLIPCLLIVFLLPNVSEIFQSIRPILDHKDVTQTIGSKISLRFRNLVLWKASGFQAATYGILFFVLIHLMASKGKSPFLYFQF